MRHTPESDAVCRHAYTYGDGYLYSGEASGHRVDIDKELAKKYFYGWAQLPLNTLLACTMYNG